MNFENGSNNETTETNETKIKAMIEDLEKQGYTVEITDESMTNPETLNVMVGVMGRIEGASRITVADSEGNTLVDITKTEKAE